MLIRRKFLTLLAASALPVPARAAAGAVGFHYFGALDCPICASFRADGLAELQSRADAGGVTFVMRETASLRDLHRSGVFEDLNPLWLKTVRRSGYGVPAFALTDQGRFIDSRSGDWKDLMVLALSRAKAAT